MSSLTMVFGFFCATISIIYIYILYIYLYIYIYNRFGFIKDWFLIKCCKKCHFTDLNL